MTTTRMVITVSREEGSGAGEIAQEIARKLKLTFLDSQLITTAVKQLGLTEAELIEYDEKVSPLMEKLAKSASPLKATPSTAQLVMAEQSSGPVTHIRRGVKEPLAIPDDLFGAPELRVNLTPDEEKTLQLFQKYHRLQNQIIMEAAAKGNAVIMGRGANFLLDGWTGVVNLHFCAPLQYRIRRLTFQYHLSETAARQQIQEKDAQRAAYVKHYYHQDWTNPELYHMVINSARYPVAAISASLVAFVKKLDQMRNVQDQLSMHEIYERLSGQESYTAEEAAQLLLLNPETIKQAVYRGELKGTVLNHKVTRINREALIEWRRNFRQN